MSNTKDDVLKQLKHNKGFMEYVNDHQKECINGVPKKFILGKDDELLLKNRLMNKDEDDDE